MPQARDRLAGHVACGAPVSDAVVERIMECHCGHADSTHYRGPDGANGSCLAAHCDCTIFMDRWGDKVVWQYSQRPLDVPRVKKPYAGW